LEGFFPGESNPLIIFLTSNAPLPGGAFFCEFKDEDLEAKGKSNGNDVCLRRIDDYDGNKPGSSAHFLTYPCAKIPFEYILVYTMLIAKVVQKFNQYKIKYALVGGHAVALHGAVRGTVDIDFILKWSLKNLKMVEKALSEINLFPRHPIHADDIYQFRAEYIQNRNLIAWNFINPNDPTEQVDIVITFDLEGKKTKKIKAGSLEIILLGIDELIVMKKVSGRPQDIEDIMALQKIKRGSHEK
jgi:hypothetical protein